MTQDSLLIETNAEADAMTENVLHCGTVRVGDYWDTDEAWGEDTDIRALARQVLLDYRRDGSLPDEETRRKLAVCCG